ncbi:MAG: TerC family protein [Bacteroidetes bacterium]|nr:MAG: TerC family protein [Bacteroidota bacterium]
MDHQSIMWIGFNVFVLAMLALDLGVFHRTAHVVKMKEALTWSAVWIALALVFNVLIYYYWDWMSPESGYTNKEAALAFLTGYLIEKSLSVDNVFVFLMVFTYFQVPSLYQHKVLFWGILGALVMRAIFIFAGVAMITKFHWTIYLFGALLIVTGIKMLTQKDKKMDPEKNPVIKAFRKWFPVSKEYHGDHFFAKIDGRRVATPMFVVLLFIETTDVIFAVDSIPAILAITSNPFIVYTSNVFAILGLRALYFALAGIMNLFHYLSYGLSVILVFVGSKMMLVDLYKIPVDVSLMVVMGILALSVLASKLFPPKEKAA